MRWALGNLALLERVGQVLVCDCQIATSQADEAEVAKRDQRGWVRRAELQTKACVETGRQLAQSSSVVHTQDGNQGSSK